MSYVSSTIGRVLDQINRTYFLPAIQRPFVWQPDQIVALFDSLLKGYPISSFLFWEIKPDRRSDWEIYKFIENFRFGETHNEMAETDGREVVLVLDGQQRLTSLLIGLRGTFTVRAKHGRRNNPDAWSRQRLYIDLLKDPATEAEDSGPEELGVTYGLRFAEQEPKNDQDHLWLKIGRILDCTSDDVLDRLADEMLANRLGNLQLLLGRENLEKSNIPFAQWIQTRDDEFLRRHLIPKNRAFWDVTELPKFVEAREELIRERLRGLGLRPVDDDRLPDQIGLEAGVGN